MGPEGVAGPGDTRLVHGHAQRTPPRSSSHGFEKGLLLLGHFVWVPPDFWTARWKWGSGKAGLVGREDGGWPWGDLAYPRPLPSW